MSNNIEFFLFLNFLFHQAVNCLFSLCFVFQIFFWIDNKNFTTLRTTNVIKIIFLASNAGILHDKHRAIKTRVVRRKNGRRNNLTK